MQEKQKWGRPFVDVMNPGAVDIDEVAIEWE